MGKDGNKKPLNWHEILRIFVDVTRIIIEIFKLVLKLRGF